MNAPVHKDLWKGTLAISLVTVLWGSTFAIIKDTMSMLSPAWVMLLRFGIALLIFLPWLRRKKIAWRASAELGLWLWMAYASQTVGLQYTSAGRCAFITATMVIFVPLFQRLGGKKIASHVWWSALGALLGVQLLCFDGSAPNLGDLWSLVCACCYAMYVVRLARYMRKLSALELTAHQMAGVAVFSLAQVAVEGQIPAEIPWAEVLYLGVFTTALTTWVQTWGQGVVGAARAAVIYSMEPVWAALLAWVFLGEVLGVLGWIGGALVGGSVLWTQIPRRRSAS